MFELVLKIIKFLFKHKRSNYIWSKEALWHYCKWICSVLLHFCLAFISSKLMKVILPKNINSTLFFLSIFQDGWTALIAACKEGHHEIAKELLEGGAKVQLPDLVNGE